MNNSKYYIIDGKRHRKYKYDRHTRKRIFLDPFGDPYYGKGDDRVETISVTIPSSLLARVDEIRGDEITMSRFVRKSLEFILEKFENGN